MLYALLYPLGDTFIGFNVFRYLTFRTGLAIATAFFISLVAGPWMISKLRALQVRQSIREEGPEHHQVKVQFRVFHTAESLLNLLFCDCHACLEPGLERVRRAVHYTTTSVGFR